MQSRRSDSAFHQEYSSAWQRHRSGACPLSCHYCVQANKFRGLSWRFIPSDKYAAFTKHERERKVNEKESKKRRGLIIPHSHAPMIYTAQRGA